MNKKNFILIMIYLATISCGFTPVAFYKENLSINIEVLDYEGDYQLNSALRSKLAIHRNEKEGDLYKVKIKSKYEKKDLSKDASGNIESYDLIASTTFEVTKDETINSVTFNEKFSMENFSDDSEEDSYEKEIKVNFAESIYNKFISHILKSQ